MSGGFLGRWSQRKLSQKQEEEARRDAPDSLDEQAADPDVGACDTATQDESQEISAASQNEEELSEEELAALPPVDSITRETDLRQFMRKGVPAALKAAALRKMWLADPAIRNHVDYAVDYAWDWNTPGGVPGNAGQILGESVAKMRDSILPEPVSDRNQSNPPDHATPESASRDAVTAQGDDQEIQPEGEQAAEPKVTGAMPDDEADDFCEPARMNVAEGAKDSADSPASAKTGDAMPRKSGEDTTRPKRHGGAIPS